MHIFAINWRRFPTLGLASPKSRVVVSERPPMVAVSVTMLEAPVSGPESV